MLSGKGRCASRRNIIKPQALSVMIWEKELKLVSALSMEARIFVSAIKRYNQLKLWWSYYQYIQNKGRNQWTPVQEVEPWWIVKYTLICSDFVFIRIDIWSIIVIVGSILSLGCCRPNSLFSLLLTPTLCHGDRCLSLGFSHEEVMKPGQVHHTPHHTTRQTCT